MKLKTNLLFSVLKVPESTTKYSQSYLNLQNVFEIEDKEGFEFPSHIIEDFDKLTKKYNNFINEVPLKIVERYYMQYRNNFNKFVFFEFNEKEVTDLTIIELYSMLESFFDSCFNLACQIAKYYNLEIKINQDSEQSETRSNFF